MFFLGVLKLHIRVVPQLTRHGMVLTCLRVFP